MNPIVHAEIGWLCSQSRASRRERWVITAAAILPDLDGAGILFSDELYAAWHHKVGHGLPAAVGFTVLALLVTRSWRVAGLACLAFHTHIVADLVGSGPGWPIWYLWPWSELEWLPSWQWDLASWQNSLIGLAFTLAGLSGALWWKRTPVELFSTKADAAVVATLRARFAREKSPN